MIDVNELRKGVTFEVDEQIFRVLEYSHNKPGRGNATIRCKLRNLKTGATIDRTFQSGDRVQDIRLDHHQVQYLYKDGGLYYFMDTETYEQPALSGGMLGDNVQYLKEGLEVKLTFFQDEPIEIEMPAAAQNGNASWAPCGLRWISSGLRLADHDISGEAHVVVVAGQQATSGDRVV